MVFLWFFKSEKAKAMNLDLVMMNASINPAICKTLNYKEEVYSKFAKEVIQQESEASKEKKQKLFSKYFLYHIGHQFELFPSDSSRKERQ